MDTRSHGAAALSRLGSLGGLIVAFTSGAFLVGCAAVTEPEDEGDPDANAAPTADAGDDFVVSAGLPVLLRGLGSDGDGDAVTFRWFFEDKPEDSEAELDDETSETPTFTPDTPGGYLLGLVVSDGQLESAPDTARITADDNTVAATIGPAGGTVGTDDGRLSVGFGADVFEEEVEVGLTPILRRQTAALHPDAAARIAEDSDTVGYDVSLMAGAVAEGTDFAAAVQYVGRWNVPPADGGTASFSADEIYLSSDGGAAPLDAMVTDVDWSGGVLHTGMMSTWGRLSPVDGPQTLEFAGFPMEVEVGETFEGTLSGAWTAGLGPEPAEVEVNSFASAPAAGVSPVPGNGSFRLDVTGGAFSSGMSYRCEGVGPATVSLDVTTLAETGDPIVDGLARSIVHQDVTCVDGEEEGITKGLRHLSRVQDVEAVVVLDGPLGSLGDVRGAALFGRGGAVVVSLVDGLPILFDGIQDAELSIALERGSVTRYMTPTLGPVTTILGTERDWVVWPDPLGGTAYTDHDGSGGFSDRRAISGSYLDHVPAGGPVTDEIVGVTGFGVEFLSLDPDLGTWDLDLDRRLPVERYGTPGRELVTSALAYEAGGPLIVTTSSNFGEDGRLFFDDRVGAPVDIGALGQSPGHVRCSHPICIVPVSRDDAIRVVHWNGMDPPEIVGDPVPVGTGPGAVAMYDLPDGNKLAAVFTGFGTDVVNRIELDDAGTVLSNQSMDVGDAGCRDPRGGDWLRNPAEPDNPFLIVGCYVTDAIYVTQRYDF